MVGGPSIALRVAPTHRVSLVRVTDDAGVAWLAEVEDFPESPARASTPEEAVRRAWAAVEESHAEPTSDGVALPSPTAAPRHSGKLLVRMPATLHDELAQAAESEGVSLNQLINGILAGAVHWRSVDDAPGANPGDRWYSGRLTPIVLGANFTVVLVAAIVAITVLVVALRGGA
jgi:predicted RNase H-like HicB family nuclease